MPRLLIRHGFVQDGRDLLPGEIHDVSDAVARREIASGSAVLAPEPTVVSAVAPTPAPPAPVKGKGRR